MSACLEWGLGAAAEPLAAPSTPARMVTGHRTLGSQERCPAAPGHKHLLMLLTLETPSCTYHALSETFWGLLLPSWLFSALLLPRFWKDFVPTRLITLQP